MDTRIQIVRRTDRVCDFGKEEVQLFTHLDGFVATQTGDVDARIVAQRIILVRAEDDEAD